MSKNIETLEQALAHIQKLEEQIKSLEAGLQTEKEAHKATKNEKTQAEKMALEAINSANIKLKETPGDVNVTVNKKKYKVLFGVDGLTKEELAEDKAALERLVKIKSGALELLED